MPYIVQRERLGLTPRTDHVAQKPGELNFQITMLVQDYLNNNGLNYTNINAVIGALECAKLELYRRIAVQYEDEKIDENGDVYNVRK